MFLRMLAGKERDLILAAELGKALLLKNEELSRKNEQMAEEYSFKLEVIHLFIYSFIQYIHSYIHPFISFNHLFIFYSFIQHDYPF